jgi:hypothetical protein
MTRRRQGIVALAAIGAAAAALIVVELAAGAIGFGDSKAKDACTSEASFPGSGLDAEIQRIVLSGLNGAACELGTTREELVLSFDPSLATEPIRWDHATIERSVRAGLLRAIADARAQGSINDLTAVVLTQLAERAPLDWLIDRGSALQKILEGLGSVDLGKLLGQLSPSDLRQILGALGLGTSLTDLLSQLGLG